MFIASNFSEYLPNYVIQNFNNSDLDESIKSNIKSNFDFNKLFELLSDCKISSKSL